MRLLPLAFAIAITAPIFAAPAPAPVTAPAWVVDKGASKLSFSAAMNGQSFNGVFRRWDAAIRFDPKSLASSSVTVRIDTGSAATGDQTRDEALPSAEWFAAAIFPRASFTATQFKSLGNDRYQAIGVLTIRNVRRPIVLPFILKFSGDVARMHGALTLDRRIFGVGQGQFAGTETVAAAVRIDVTVTAKRLH
jgi:polyisoprenoid-binding protein YceI